MDPEDLRTLIDTGSMSRPAVIQQQRSEIRRITGISPPQDRGEMKEWWSKNKSYVSRKVNEQLSDEEESEEESKLDEEELDEEELDGEELDGEELDEEELDEEELDEEELDEEDNEELTEVNINE